MFNVLLCDAVLITDRIQCNVIQPYYNKPYYMFQLFQVSDVALSPRMVGGLEFFFYLLVTM